MSRGFVSLHFYVVFRNVWLLISLNSNQNYSVLSISKNRSVRLVWYFLGSNEYYQKIYYSLKYFDRCDFLCWSSFRQNFPNFLITVNLTLLCSNLKLEFWNSFHFYVFDQLLNCTISLLSDSSCNDLSNCVSVVAIIFCNYCWKQYEYHFFDVH